MIHFSSFLSKNSTGYSHRGQKPLRRLVLVSLVCFLTFCVPCKGQSVSEWVCTTPNLSWLRLDPRTVDVTGGEQADAIVDVAHPAQVIEGFGACFSELGWMAISQLDDNVRNSILDELFTPGAGANFNYCRMPIGANDIANSWYSYNETAGDFKMRHFTIAHDKESMIPFIKEALKRNPKMKLWATPWCPPTWMKVNHHYACKPLSARAEAVVGANGLQPNQICREGTDAFIMKDKYLKAYSLYFTKFIESYRKEGINISMVMPQNEFNSDQPFPSCVWRSSSLARFVGRYLGPVMKKLGVDVFFGTMERPNPALVDTILTDTYCKKYVHGVGFQWAGKKALPDIRKRYPDIKIFQSEQECGFGANDWKGCVYAWGLMKHYFNYGASVYDYWNIALEQGGMSHWGWKQNSLITVNKADKTYKFTYEYYLLKHLSHYVDAGSVFLPVRGEFKDMLAFRSPEGHCVLVIFNSEDQEVKKSVKVGDKCYRLTLVPNSINTLVVK